MAINVEAHITGTVWKIEVAVGDEVSDGDTRGHPRVDEDGDAGRGRGRRQGHRDPLRGGPVRAGGRRPRGARRVRGPGHARRAQARPARRGGRPAHDLQPRQAQRARPRRPRRARPRRCRRSTTASRPAASSITGEGTMFSAGYDIGGIPDRAFSEDAEALVAHPFHAAMEAISAHPYPVVAAINGHCLGGGLELAVRCDLRLCAEGAKLGMPPAKLGLIYGHTGLQRFIEVDRGRPHQGALPRRPQPRRICTRRRSGSSTGGGRRPSSSRRGGRAGRRDRRNAPSRHARQQARDRGARAHPVLDPEQERELVELRALVLHLRGLPRGHRAPSPRSASRAGRAAKWARRRTRRPGRASDPEPVMA